MFFDILTRYPAPPPPVEATLANVYSKVPAKSGLMVGKRAEAEEIARINDAMKEIVTKTNEYKTQLATKRKELDELNASLET
jgi:hypothetical protein